MKKLFSSVFVMICFLTANAQSIKGDHEISVGIGTRSEGDILSGFYNPDAEYAAGTYRVYKPIFSASYKYYLSNRFAIGIMLAEHSYREIWYSGHSLTYHNTSYDAVMVSVDMKVAYPRTNRRYFQMYFTGAIGAAYMVEANKTEFLPCLYVSPLGFRIGNLNALFIELGIGDKGLIHGGYSLRLGGDKDDASGTRRYRESRQRYR